MESGESEEVRKEIAKKPILEQVLVSPLWIFQRSVAVVVVSDGWGE
jgi:hypothetical protein